MRMATGQFSAYLLGAGCAAAGIAVVEMLLAAGMRPLGPIGWPGAAVVVGALLWGAPAAIGAAAVALLYTGAHFGAQERFPLFFAHPVTAFVFATGLGVLAAIGVWMRARISRQQAVESALKESEARFRQLTALSSDWYWELDADMRFTRISGSGLGPFGLSEEMLVGKRALEVPGYSLVSPRAEEFERLRAQRLPYRGVRGQYALADGRRRFVSVDGDPVFDDAGSFCGYRGVARDITAQLAAEDTLTGAKERLQRALEGSNLALWETDLGSGTVFLSAGWAEMLGEPPGETRTTVRELAKLVPPDEVAELDRQSRETIKGVRAFYSVEHRVRTRGGAWKWIRSTGKVSERGADGRALRMSGTNRDITEQKQAELALLEAKAQVERANAELEERVRARTAELEALVKELETFHYAVAHDLHTSLGVMSVNAGMLMNDLGESLATDHRQALARIAENAQLTARLLDDLLAYSRLGREAVQPAPAPMAQLARDAWRKLARAEPERQLSFEAGSLPDCRGDQRMLAQLWARLFSNAIKFTRTRGEARVAVGFDPATSAYFVRDNGVGFDMQYADKLFGVFERLHQDAGFEGTGVGLAIAARIVRRHGGRIWAEARPDEGATFYFTLP